MLICIEHTETGICSLWKFSEICPLKLTYILRCVIDTIYGPKFKHDAPCYRIDTVLKFNACQNLA